MYTVYIWFWPTLGIIGREITKYTAICIAYIQFWHQTYGHTQSIYTVLANPNYDRKLHASEFELGTPRRAVCRPKL
jgi:hypothetical protein